MGWWCCYGEKDGATATIGGYGGDGAAIFSSPKFIKFLTEICFFLAKSVPATYTFRLDLFVDGVVVVVVVIIRDVRQRSCCCRDEEEAKDLVDT